MGCDQQWDHYTKMRANSFWVSLDFEWIWTFLSNEIGYTLSQQGQIVTNNELFH
jgi:hypothetical protein